MYEVLAFGDSLTRGANPGAGQRHRFEDRWPNVLQAGLDGFAHVSANGLGGRTTAYDDPEGGVSLNGSKALPALLADHSSLNLTMIMLGANDLKPSIHGYAEGVAAGVEALIDIVQGSRSSKTTLVISPPNFVASPNFGGQPRGGRSIAESRRVAPMLEIISRRREVAFFDAATVAFASTVDGVHLDSENTRALGMALIPIVRNLLSAQ
ncbi:arylesterase [Devosia sp. BK]|uniref:GDSL-type esterase/lipase family protein n=1 Tax=Devosia sp. BK TaxID=2871706 RepID=UPI00293AA833|nr:GDSL-type esterase/lipase family protein [Devosia sp. BK]MDV3252328.1 arylesterase [Devosia sp. BK]